MAAAAVRARRVDKVAVVDVAWGLGFVLVALVASLVAQAETEGPVDEDLACAASCQLSS